MKSGQEMKSRKVRGAFHSSTVTGLMPVNAITRLKICCAAGFKMGLCLALKLPQPYSASGEENRNPNARSSDWSKCDFDNFLYPVSVNCRTMMLTHFST